MEITNGDVTCDFLDDKNCSDLTSAQSGAILSITLGLITGILLSILSCKFYSGGMLTKMFHYASIATSALWGFVSMSFSSIYVCCVMYVSFMCLLLV